MRLALVLLLGSTLAAHAAHAGALCTPGAPHRGRAIDLDVRGADVHDVLRLLADAGGVNLVVSDRVAGRVTLKVTRAAWDAIACTIAALHHLELALDDRILVVTPAGGSRSPRPTDR